MTMTDGDLQELERASIESFVSSQSGYLTGTVLDLGCGKQPYRHIVEAVGGDYIAFDRADYPANVSGEDVGPDVDFDGVRFDAVLCTQVIQYLEEPYDQLLGIREMLVAGGHLVMTGPTNWPEREGEDLFRFTRAGIEKLLRWAGFDVVVLQPRANVLVATGFELSLGWGAVARA